MKKLTTILLAVMLIAALFISCENNAVENNLEETVSVNFEGGRSRTLTASLETFDKDAYYWRYTAVKTDNTGLVSGETESETPVKTSGTGLGSVSGFSQGQWEFGLYAYAEQDFKTLKYSGKMTASLKKGADNSVVVTVSPVKTESKGTLKIDSSNITITKNGVAITTNNVTKVYKVVKVGDIDSDTYSTTTEYSLDPGAYKVTVAFANDGYTYASGSVVATVYSNLTTTVTGSLEELRTDATFDSEINPDVINVVASSEDTAYSTLSTEGASAITLSNKTADSDTEKVTATVSAASAKDIVESIVKGDNEAATVSNDTKVSLAISVDTTSATESTLELEIGLSATVTDGKVSTTQSFSLIKEYATVKVNLQKGLTSVDVKHNGNAMVALNSADDTPTGDNADNGGYYYDATSGVLTVKTKSFSPFTVSYNPPVYVAKIGTKNYATLQAAFDSVKDNETIKLTNNVTSETGFLFSNNVTAEFDLNGYTLKVTSDTQNNHRAIKITNGNLTIKNGTIDARNVDENGNPKDHNDKSKYTDGIYGTIRVEGNNAKVTLDGLTLYNNHCWGMSVKIATGCESTIKNCTFNSSVGGCIEAAGGTVTISDSTFKQTGTSNFSSFVSTGIAVSYGGSVIANNSGFNVSGSHALYVYSSGGEIIVNGGSYSTSETVGKVVVVNFDSEVYGLEGSSVDYNVTQTYLDTHDGKAAIVTINDGYFDGSFELAGSGKNLTAIVVKGGTFSVEPSAYVAEGYKSVPNAETNPTSWTVTDDYVCYITNSGDTTYYKTLKDAVEKASYNDKITLISNVDLSEGFVLGKSLTLDMAGCNITCTNPITVFATTNAITLDLMNSSETESLIDGTYTYDTSKCQLANFSNASAKLIFDKGVKYTGGKGIEVYGGQLIISGSIKADSPAVLVSGSGAKLTSVQGKIDGGLSILDGASLEYAGSYVRN